MSQLPGKNKTTLQREAHTRSCVASAKNWKKFSISEDERAVGAWDKESWFNKARARTGRAVWAMLRTLQAFYLKIDLICSNMTTSFSPWFSTVKTHPYRDQQIRSAPSRC